MYSDPIKDPVVDAVKKELLGEVLNDLLVNGTFENPGQTNQQAYVNGFQMGVLGFARRLKVRQRDICDLAKRTDEFMKLMLKAMEPVDANIVMVIEIESFQAEVLEEYLEEK